MITYRLLKALSDGLYFTVVLCMQGSYREKKGQTFRESEGMLMKQVKAWSGRFGFLAVIFLLSGCFGNENLSALDPKGPQAQWIYDNMILSLYIMAFVTLVVFAIFFYIIAKFRRKEGDNEYPKQVHGSTVLEITWTVIPILLLLVLFVPTIIGTFDFAESQAPEDVEDAVYIDVTGHQYWWQFDYEEGFTAGQEVYIPTGERVYFTLNATDVIHSFWVPALGGKIDTVPGIENTLWLEADEPGTYMGKCAELCGPSHALMDFKLIALERDDYDQWVEDMAAKADVEQPEDSSVQQGYEVFQENCISCHAVSGPGSASGPTLTNFGDRNIIAGYLDNTDEQLKAWIRNPDDFKQGNNMVPFPESEISEDEMDSLVAYLRSLSVRDGENAE